MSRQYGLRQSVHRRARRWAATDTAAMPRRRPLGPPSFRFITGRLLRDTKLPGTGVSHVQRCRWPQPGPLTGDAAPRQAAVSPSAVGAVGGAQGVLAPDDVIIGPAARSRGPEGAEIDARKYGSRS